MECMQEFAGWREEGLQARSLAVFKTCVDLIGDEESKSLFLDRALPPLKQVILSPSSPSQLANSLSSLALLAQVHSSSHPLLALAVYFLSLFLPRLSPAPPFHLFTFHAE